MRSWLAFPAVVTLIAVGLLITQREPDTPRALTAQELSLLDEAEQILLRACMAEEGFRVWVPPAGLVPAAREFPYVLDDVAWARDHGYGSDIARRIDEVSAADPNRRYFQSLSPQRREAALDALHGEHAEGLEALLPTGGVVSRSSEGCTSEAEQALYSDLTTWFRVERVTESLLRLQQAQVRQDRVSLPASPCGPTA